MEIDQAFKLASANRKIEKRSLRDGEAVSHSRLEFGFSHNPQILIES
jgi:hypothetical protein